MIRGKQVLAILLVSMLSFVTITTPVIASDGYESDEISEESIVADEEANSKDDDTNLPITEGESSGNANVEDSSSVISDDEEGVNTYTVTLDANGGYFLNEWDDILNTELETTEILNKRIPIGESVTSFPVYEKTASNENSSQKTYFAGWSLEQNGELVSSAYECYVPLDSCTLYAVWENSMITDDEDTSEQEIEVDDEHLDETNESNEPDSIERKTDGDAAFDDSTKTTDSNEPAIDDNHTDNKGATVSQKNEEKKELSSGDSSTATENEGNNEILEDIETITTKAAYSSESSEWFWPTSNHTIKSDWPNYSSGSYHGGTDFSVPLDTPVYSTCAGKVVMVKSLTTSYGKHIKIQATVNGNIVYIRYCHLNSFCVSEGEYVKAGQLIGYSGSTGNSTGPHLHYEVRNSDDRYGNSSSPNLNPRNYLPGTSFTFVDDSKRSVDLGTDFYAYIIADSANSWRHITTVNDNVQVSDYNDSLDPRQIWRFLRQPDNSYKVINEFDGCAVLDAEGAITTNGANVAIWSDHGGDNQRWYIAYTDDTGVSLINKKTGMALDCDGGSFSPGTNIHTWEINETRAQDFCVYNLTNDNRYYSKPDKPDKVTLYQPKGCLTGVPITFTWSEAGLKGEFDNRTYDIRVYKGGKIVRTVLGINDTSIELVLDDPGEYTYTVASVNSKYYEWYRISDEKAFCIYSVHEDYPGDFYAYIIADGAYSWRHITTVNDNVQVSDYNDSLDPKQIWHFTKQSDNSYKIINEFDGCAVLDAEGFVTTNGANVAIWSDHGGKNQRWYIVDVNEGGVALINQFSFMALDCNEGSFSPGTNVQTWQINGSRAQTFSVYDLSNDKTNYVKPNKPDKVTPYQPKECFVGTPTTFSWSEAGLKSEFDNRTYNIRIYKAGKIAKTILGINETSIKIVLDEPGEYSFTVASVNSKYYEWYRISDEVDFIVSNHSISNATVAGILNKIYTGAAQTQNPTVKVGDKILTNGTDYTLSYSNNINVGTATVTITGKGNYTGTVSKSFAIGSASIASATVTGISNKTYNGSAQTQNPNVKVGDKTLSNGTDYTLSYSNNTNAGTATMTITGKGNYSESLSKTFTISAASIANATVTGISNKTYSGSAQTQAPTVKVGDKTLTNGTDYTLSYANNTNAGTATVTITGKGNYSESLSKAFTISAASIANADITGISNKAYTGSALTQNPTVKVGGKTLTNGTDYTLSYSSNTNVGTATITITGKGNYTGTVNRSFTIGGTSIANATVTGISSKTYNGSAQTQAPTVKVGDKTLTNGTDYTLSYANNINAGTATVTITGKGNYSESLSKTFTISAASIASATVTGISNKTYNGSAQTQAFTVKIGDKTLTNGTDYTLSYTNNTNAGTATVTITGKGNYAESLNKTFTISAASIANADVTGISNKAYTGSAQTQSPTVKVGDKTLTNGTDYTLSYSNNTNVGTATVTITGKGNYTGTISRTFAIGGVSIASATVTGISNKTYNGSAQTQNPTVKVGDKTLTNGTDYTLSYANNTNAGTATVTVTGKGNYSESISKTFTISAASIASATVTGISNKTYNGSAQTQAPTVKVGDKTLANGTDYTLSYSNNINAGTATVTITGKGNYSESLSKTFTISAASIASATVTGISNKTYNGSAQTQDPTVKIGDKTLTNGTDYSLSYSNNINAGTATVTISGKENYANTVSKTFTINAESIANADITGIMNKAYTGSALTQNPTVRIENKTLTKGTDYTLAYSNNTNAGTATVMIIGTGNYTGTVTRAFTIGGISIANATVTGISNKTYNGSAQTQNPTVKVGDKTLTNGTDYTLSYSNNINAGTATVTISGTGKYAEEVIKTFTISAASIANADVTGISNKPYTGSAQTQNPTVKIGDKVLTNETDYTLSYSDNTNVGTATVTITGKGNYTGSVSKAFTIGGISITNATVTGISDKTYNGSAQTQNPTIKVGDKTLTNGTDYSLSYANNTNAGTATMTITGKGNYSELLNKTFTINPASIANADVIGVSTKTYNGSAQTQNPTVKVGDRTLSNGTDYTLSYSNNTNVGIATVTISGKGNYVETRSEYFQITPIVQAATMKSTASTIAVGKVATVSVTGLKEDALCSYSSSNTSVAVVNAYTGEVTAKAVGKVTITATITPTKNYTTTTRSIALLVVPAATSSISATNLSKGINLNWKAVKGASGYIIYRNAKKIKTITSGSTVTYTDEAANTNGNKYTYKIVAKAATGESTLSKSIVTYRVARPSISSMKNTSAKKMTVKWSKNAKASGYQVQYSLSKTYSSSNKTFTLTGASAVSKVIGSLTKGKKYYARVRAYKSVNGKKYYSAWSPAKSISITK